MLRKTHVPSDMPSETTRRLDISVDDDDVEKVLCSFEGFSV